MRVLIAFLQIIAAWLFGFVLVYVLGIGNGWEVLAIPFAMTIAVLLVGGIFNRKMLTIRTFLTMWFIAGIGGLIMWTGIVRVLGIFLPLIGAIGVYWTRASQISKGV